MNHGIYTFCRERRAGIDRRRYRYDSHLPDRRTPCQRRSGADRRRGRLEPPSLTVSCRICEALKQGRSIICTVRRGDSADPGGFACRLAEETSQTV